MAVAIGIFAQIILVIIFCVIKIRQGFIFYHNFLRIFFCQIGKGFINDWLIIGIGIINAGAVLRPAVIALFVETGRVNHPHVVRQEGRKIGFIDIIDNFDGFCVP